MPLPTEIDALLAEAENLVDETQKQIGRADDAPATATAKPRKDSAKPAGKPGPLDRVLKLEVPVIVTLAQRSMRFRDVLRLTAGTILEFDQPASADLRLMINNKCIGTGKAVKVGENFGLSISSISSKRRRIEAMAGDVQQ